MLIVIGIAVYLIIGSAFASYVCWANDHCDLFDFFFGDFTGFLGFAILWPVAIIPTIAFIYTKTRFIKENANEK